MASPNSRFYNSIENLRAYNKCLERDNPRIPGQVLTLLRLVLDNKIEKERADYALNIILLDHLLNIARKASDFKIADIPKEILYLAEEKLEAIKEYSAKTNNPAPYIIAKRRYDKLFGKIEEKAAEQYSLSQLVSEGGIE